MARVPPQYRHIWQSTWLCVCNNIQTVHGIPTGLASQTDSPMATAMRAIACHKDSEGASSALCPSVYCPAEYTVHAALQHGHLYSLEWSGVEFCLIETVPFKHLYRDYLNRYSMAKPKRHRRERCQADAKWLFLLLSVLQRRLVFGFCSK